MQKYVDLKSLGTKLQIISAFALDHIKGCIYIEADKQCDINEVIYFCILDNVDDIVMTSASKLLLHPMLLLVD